MPDFLHRTTKSLLVSASPNSLPEAITNYIQDPDLSGVVGVPIKYWNIVGDVVSEMSVSEKAVVDAALLTASRDETVDREVDNIEGIIRAFALTVLDEINTLRGQHSLSNRTIAQLKTAIRNKLGS